MNVYELKIKIYLLKDIKNQEVNTKLSCVFYR